MERQLVKINVFLVLFLFTFKICYADTNYNTVSTEHKTKDEILSLGLKNYQNKQFSSAAYFFEKACKKESAEACFFLGSMYYNGIGVQKNKIKANELMQLSSKLTIDDLGESR